MHYDHFVLTLLVNHWCLVYIYAQTNKMLYTHSRRRGGGGLFFCSLIFFLTSALSECFAHTVASQHLHVRGREREPRTWAVTYARRSPYTRAGEKKGCGQVRGEKVCRTQLCRPRTLRAAAHTKIYSYCNNSSSSSSAAVNARVLLLLIERQRHVHIYVML